jgi:FG-GAP-like repeat
MRSAIWLGVTLGTFGGCYAFDEPQLGLCGNSIIETDEDCDDTDEEHCRECHLVCTPHVSTTGCPPSRVCGNDGLCRAASGEFAADPIRIDQAGTRWLAAGDLDGDHLEDIVAQLDGDLDAVHVSPQQSIDLVSAMGRAAVGDLDDDGRADVVLGTFVGDAPGSLSVLREVREDDLTRVPAALVLPTLRTEGSFARLVAVSEPDRVLELVAPDVTRAWHRGLQQALPLDPPLAIDPGQLAAAIAVADLDGDADPCADAVGARTEIALATIGAGAVSIASTCGGTDPFELVLRPPVVLPPGLGLGAAGTFFAAVNGDQQLDLVTQSEAGAVLVAYGVGDGTFHSDTDVPLASGDGNFAAAALWSPDVGDESLIAVADFDGDNAADLVTEHGYVLDPRTCTAPCLVAWPQAVLAASAVDLNGDGALDLVSARERVLEVRLGHGGSADFGFTTAHEFPIAGTGSALAAGDFNGDTLSDVAFIDHGDSVETDVGDRVTVLYGGALDDWRLQSFGPFPTVESLVVDGLDTLVVRILDDQGRAAGAFIRPGASSADFGIEVHQPVVVRAGDARVVAAIALDPELDAERIVHFGFVDGALSPHDVVRGAILDGVPAGRGVDVLAAAIELGGDPEVDELVVLGTTAQGGTVWTFELDPATGEWSQLDRFVFDRGFARAPMTVDEDAAPPSGGPGSSLAIGDVDGDGDADVLATTDEALPNAVVLVNDAGVLSATRLRETTHFMAFELALLDHWHADGLGAMIWLVGGDDGVGLATVDLELGRLVIKDVSGAHASGLTAADVDGDGLLDLVIATDHDLRIHPAQERLGGE